ALAHPGLYRGELGPLETGVGRAVEEGADHAVEAGEIETSARAGDTRSGHRGKADPVVEGGDRVELAEAVVEGVVAVAPGLAAVGGPRGGPAETEGGRIARGGGELEGEDLELDRKHLEEALRLD